MTVSIIIWLFNIDVNHIKDIIIIIIIMIIIIQADAELAGDATADA